MTEQPGDIDPHEVHPPDEDELEGFLEKAAAEAGLAGEEGPDDGEV